MEFLSFFIILLSLSSIHADVISVPLRKMKTVLQRLGAMNIHPSKLQRYIEGLPAGNSSEQLYKFLDSEFYGEVLLGHPGQKFNVIFDTAWANSWIPSQLCPLTDLACTIHNRYSSSESSTYIPNGESFDVKLGKYNLTGRLSTDLLHIGQVNVTNQTFAEIIGLPWIYAFSKADGVLGLAFDKYSVNNVTPFFYNMLKQKVVNKPIFSFYMNRDPSTNKGGTLFFGGVQQKHYKGNFTFARIEEKAYWKFKMEGIFVKGSSESFCKGGCEAIADTSTNIISGPEIEIIKINQLIRARPFYFERYSVDCAIMGKLPQVSFSIGGRVFTLKAKDYIQKLSWGGFMLCLSSFTKTDFPASYGNIWSLGGAFLSHYYVQFDMSGDSKIGFADALL